MKRIVHKVDGVAIPMGLLPNGMQVMLSPKVVHSDESLQAVERLELVRARLVYLQSTVPPGGILHAGLDEALDLLRGALTML